MGHFKRGFLPIVASFAAVCLTLPVSAISLNEIIGDAVTHNPQQQANDLTVQSYKLDAEGTRKDTIYPQIGLSVGDTRAQPNQNMPGGNDMNAGVSASETVYDGHAGLDNVKALDWAAKAQQALYESTDPYVPYTAGSVAQQVFNLYVSWASIRAQRKMDQTLIDVLKEVLPLTRDNKAIALLNSTIQSNQDQVNASNKTMTSTFEDLCYYSFTQLPKDIDSLAETNQQMKNDLDPYQNVQKAVRTAKQRNYDYLARLYQLKETIEQDRATRAQLTRPVVTVNLGDSWSESRTFEAGVPITASAGPYVGMQVTMPISFGLRDHLQASHFRVLAAEKQVRQQEADFTYTIESTFRDLNDVDAEAAEYNATMQADYALISKFVEDHIKTNTEFTYNDITQLSGLLNNWGGSAMSYLGSLSQAVTYRYNLEVAIGILFDSANYHRNRLTP